MLTQFFFTLLFLVEVYLFGQQIWCNVKFCLWSMWKNSGNKFFLLLWTIYTVSSSQTYKYISEVLIGFDILRLSSKDMNGFHEIGECVGI